MVNLINNKKNQITILAVILVLNVLVPFAIYPLIEKNLVDIYEKSFSDIDSSLILASIKSLLYIYLWSNQLFFLGFRILCLAGLYLLGFYLLEVKHSMGYKEIVVTLLFAETILLVGKFLTISFNYLQESYNWGEFRLLESPLAVIYYFPQITKSSPLYLLLSNLNLFSAVYFYFIIKMLSKRIDVEKYKVHIVTIFVISVWLIIEVINPIQKVFFDSPGGQPLTLN